VAPYASQPAPLEAGGQRTGDAWHSSYRLRTRSRPSNARYRRAVKARGHFPTEQAALKCLYLVTRSLYPHWNRPGKMGHEMEASQQRIRNHVQRPVPGRRDLLTTAGNTVS